MICHTNKQQVNTCSCEQCECTNDVCETFVKQARCRNCALTCRDWLCHFPFAENVNSESLENYHIFIVVSSWTK